MRIPSCGVDSRNVTPVFNYPCGCAYLATGDRISCCKEHANIHDRKLIAGDEWMSDTEIAMYSDETDARMAVAMNDVNNVNERDRTYGSSWKKRGGVGAFMMMARKWDRIENIMNKNTSVQGYGHANAYDIFQHIELNAGDVLDDLRDLRRYLLLIESEMLLRGKVVLDEPAVQEASSA